MSDMPLYVELSLDGKTIRLNGRGGPSADGLVMEHAGVDGWYSTPDAKVSMTEMQTGDGAHAVQESAILYGARTVTIPWASVGASRDEAVAGLLRLLSTAHRMVRVRLVDDSTDTYVEGYTQVGADPTYMRRGMTGTLTVVCPDPRRYSTALHRIQLTSSMTMSGGLSYGDGSGLSYPLSYGESDAEVENVGTAANAGTSPAFPVITVNGPIAGGLRLDWDGGSVAYSQPVGAVPLVLDSLTRTASVGGVDASRNLASRAFPSIAPGGSTRLAFQASGSGWATAEWRDTYI